MGKVRPGTRSVTAVSSELLCVSWVICRRTENPSNKTANTSAALTCTLLRHQKEQRRVKRRSSVADLLAGAALRQRHQ